MSEPNLGAAVHPFAAFIQLANYICTAPNPYHLTDPNPEFWTQWGGQEGLRSQLNQRRGEVLARITQANLWQQLDVKRSELDETLTGVVWELQFAAGIRFSPDPAVQYSPPLPVQGDSDYPAFHCQFMERAAQSFDQCRSRAFGHVQRLQSLWDCWQSLVSSPQSIPMPRSNPDAPLLIHLDYRNGSSLSATVNASRAPILTSETGAPTVAPTGQTERAEEATPTEPTEPMPSPSELEQPIADPFEKLRLSAHNDLKGKERATVEALCAAGGEMALKDLAIKEGVDFSDPFKVFEGVQRRVGPWMRRLGWTLSRRNNKARLISLPVR